MLRQRSSLARASGAPKVRPWVHVRAAAACYAHPHPPHTQVLACLQARPDLFQQDENGFWHMVPPPTPHGYGASCGPQQHQLSAHCGAGPSAASVPPVSTSHLRVRVAASSQDPSPFADRTNSGRTVPSQERKCLTPTPPTRGFGAAQPLALSAFFDEIAQSAENTPVRDQMHQAGPQQGLAWELPNHDQGGPLQRTSSKRARLS